MKKGISLYLLSSSVSIILSSNAFAGFSASEDEGLVGCIPAEWGTYYCNPTVIGQTSTEKPEYSPTVQEPPANGIIGIGSPISNYGLVESPEYPASTGIGISSMSSYDQSDIMANALAGSGITSVVSSNYTGALNASGVFINGTSSVGFEEGIILTTGDAKYAIGPNQYSFGIYTDNGTAGNSQLDSLLSTQPHLSEVAIDPYEYFGTINDGLIDYSNPIKPLPEPELLDVTSADAATLDINFVPQGDQITLSYVFATDAGITYAGLNGEFGEYAPYDNDVLGIFINGQNYAKLPNGEDLTLSNILYTTERTSWIIDNSDGTQSNIEYDFLTSRLTLTASVNSGVQNTLSISIADGYVAEMGDFTKAEDSAVFIDGALTSSLSEGAAAGSTQLNALMPDAIDEETGAFSFTFDKPEDLIFIDPEVSVGYVYEITSEHEFASVLLPLIGDGEFLLQIFNEVTGEFEGNYVLSYGVEYFFDDYTSEDVTLFQILGIEVEEELDPTDTTAFITGLTFNTLPNASNPNVVSMSQTPITQLVGDNSTPSEVPVPATLALFGLGLALMMRRRKAA